MLLDDLKVYSTIDKSGMIKDIQSLPQQLSSAWQNGLTLLKDQDLYQGINTLGRKSKSAGVAVEIFDQLIFRKNTFFLKIDP